MDTPSVLTMTILKPSRVYGFYVTYWRVKRSDETAGGSGKVTRSARAVRLGLWIATLMAVSGIVFEQIEPLLRK
jgi:hypothetical protein